MNRVITGILIMILLSVTAFSEEVNPQIAAVKAKQEQAASLAKKGNLDGAIAVYNEALAMDDGGDKYLCVDSYKGIMNAYAQKGDVKNTTAAAEKIWGLFPVAKNMGIGVYEILAAKIYAGMFTEAEAEINGMLEKKKGKDLRDKRDEYYLSALIKYRQNRKEDAADDLLYACAGSGASGPAFELAEKVHFELSEYRDYLGLFPSLLGEDGRGYTEPDPIYYPHIVEAYHAVGELERGIEFYKKALKSPVTDKAWLKKFGPVMEKDIALYEAIRKEEIYLRDHPQMPGVTYDQKSQLIKAADFIRADRKKEAIALILEFVVMFNTYDIVTCDELARLYFQTKQWSRGYYHVNRILREGRGEVGKVAYMAAGAAYTAGNYPQAIYYARANKTGLGESQRGELRFVEAASEIKMKHHIFAEKLISQDWKGNCFSGSDENIYARLMLANYLYSGRFDKGLEIVRKMLNERPDFWLAHYRAGMVYEITGDLPAAEREYLEAIKLAPQGDTRQSEMYKAFKARKKRSQYWLLD